MFLDKFINKITDPIKNDFYEVKTWVLTEHTELQIRIKLLEEKVDQLLKFHDQETK